MKKILFSLATAALLIPAAKAQDVDHADSHGTANRIRFGAYLAPTISWMRPTAAKDGGFSVKSDGSKIGFMYGLMAEYYFARNYAVVSGLQVNSTGGKMISTNTSPAVPSQIQVNKADFDYRLQYLEIPIALKLRTDDIAGFRFFGQLGATLGFNIGKKASYTVNYYDGAKDTSVSESKVKVEGTLRAIAPIMLQMNIGAGAEYPISNKLTAYLGLFFNNGFAPDATAPNKFDNTALGYKGEFTDGKTRLNNFSIRVGLFF
jgi:hypothetical protein